MKYSVHDTPSYEHLQGTEQKAHMGSQSHNGTAGAPVHAVGGGGLVGKGSPTVLEHGAPKGMDM